MSARWTLATVPATVNVPIRATAKRLGEERDIDRQSVKLGAEPDVADRIRVARFSSGDLILGAPADSQS